MGMNFISDNAYGTAPEMLAALAAANEGTAAPYGDDAITARLKTRFCEVFEREVFAYPVISGTAANALALSAITPPFGAILCHTDAHIAVDECGAVEGLSGGAKLVGLQSDTAKVTPKIVEHALSHFSAPPHSPKPSALSITQATEYGTVYRVDEIAALATVAKRARMKLHIDGARFANALTHLGSKPADITWRAGVDVLSFGATKNGALGAEAVVFFHAADAQDFEYRRKKAGHLVSKMRFVSAQLEAYLADDRWLTWAKRANDLAARMAQGLAQVAGAELAHPVEANALFVWLPDETIARLRKAGAAFYDWRPSTNGRTMARLVMSFMTKEEDIARFLSAARG
jgi:threonine aldolase